MGQHLRLQQRFKLLAKVIKKTEQLCGFIHDGAPP
jgi:hypothetical protein